MKNSKNKLEYMFYMTIARTNRDIQIHSPIEFTIGRSKLYNDYKNSFVYSIRISVETVKCINLNYILFYKCSLFLLACDLASCTLFTPLAQFE